MAKPKPRFVCQECGTEHPRWTGRCEGCGAWNSVVEEAPLALSPALARSSGKAKSAELVSLAGVIDNAPRVGSGSAEFDRVLGGGFVPGSALLLGGDPGIGKSTLLLQAAAHVAPQLPVLYFSGEESAAQIQMRARRMGLDKAPLQLATTGNLETMIATLNTERPGFVIVDSIQTVHSDKTESAPGTVSQVRFAAHELTQAAKRSGAIVVFVGHVTKDGQIAGPRLLEHMVDTVMYFEGERGHPFRVLRAFKNRFGATNEIGVFEMVESGLRQVDNPSALFLSERPAEAPGSVVMAAIEGTRPVLIEVQALVSRSALAQPRRTTLGVDPNRLAMIAAVLDKHAGFTFGGHDIFLNITGGLRVTEPAADLAIAAALVSSLLERPIPAGKVIAGEVGLAGEVRSVSQLEPRLREAEKLGFTEAIVPPLAKSGRKGSLTLHPLKKLDDLAEVLF